MLRRVLRADQAVVARQAHRRRHRAAVAVEAGGASLARRLAGRILVRARRTRRRRRVVAGAEVPGGARVGAVARRAGRAEVARRARRRRLVDGAGVGALVAAGAGVAVGERLVLPCCRVCARRTRCWAGAAYRAVVTTRADVVRCGTALIGARLAVVRRREGARGSGGDRTAAAVVASVAEASGLLQSESVTVVARPALLAVLLGSNAGEVVKCPDRAQVLVC